MTTTEQRRPAVAQAACLTLSIVTSVATNVGIFVGMIVGIALLLTGTGVAYIFAFAWFAFWLPLLALPAAVAWLLHRWRGGPRTRRACHWLLGLPSLPLYWVNVFARSVYKEGEEASRPAGGR